MLTVIDYDAGNLRSVETALRHLGATFRISAEPEHLRTADRIILPGVGDARAAMERLNASGIAEALRTRVFEGVPMLGICLGTQIILDRSEESDATCLGVIHGETVRFDDRPGRKIPHMGWNTLSISTSHPLFHNVPTDAAFYFVHSFFPQPARADTVLAETDYHQHFASVLGQDNVVATKFHPEKSGEFGLRMLNNCLSWDGGA